MFHSNDKIMKFNWFIDIDVSKAPLDAAFCHKDSPDQFTHQQLANTTAGFQQFEMC